MSPGLRPRENETSVDKLQRPEIPFLIWSTVRLMDASSMVCHVLLRVVCEKRKPAFLSEIFLISNCGGLDGPASFGLASFWFSRMAFMIGSRLEVPSAFWTIFTVGELSVSSETLM